VGRMSEQMAIIPGKCKCGKKLDLRINNVEEGLWMIHGFCTPCKVVYILQLMEQHEEPRGGIDYIIDDNTVPKITKKKPLLNLLGKKNEGNKTNRDKKR
jgi:hypothetical protein